MPYVFHASSTNSTAFTSCCEVAILGRQVCCPRCGEAVYPEFDKDKPEYSEHQRNTMRFNYAFRRGR